MTLSSSDRAWNLHENSFQASLRLYYLHGYQFPKEMSPSSYPWRYSVTAYLFLALSQWAHLTIDWLTDLSLPYSLSPSTPLSSGVRRKKLDLCSVSWNPTVLVSSLMLVASLQRKTLFSFFFWITSHQDYFL